MESHDSKKNSNKNSSSLKKREKVMHEGAASLPKLLRERSPPIKLKSPSIKLESSDIELESHDLDKAPYCPVHSPILNLQFNERHDVDPKMRFITEAPYEMSLHRIPHSGKLSTERGCRCGQGLNGEDVKMNTKRKL